MPQIIFSQGAVDGLEKCRQFLFENNPIASNKASVVIKHFFTVLKNSPEIGRPVEDRPDLRELIIPFGKSGYTALYRHEVITGDIVVLAFRHQKEAGY